MSWEAELEPGTTKTRILQPAGEFMGFASSVVVAKCDSRSIADRIVARVNAMAGVERPEALPELLKYLTAILPDHLECGCQVPGELMGLVSALGLKGEG